MWKIYFAITASLRLCCLKEARLVKSVRKQHSHNKSNTVKKITCSVDISNHGILGMSAGRDS